MPDELRLDETRVLGVLIEKSLSQPAYYPMSLNAITAACNQKSNRDPVTNYSESDVGDALATLRKKQLVTQAEPERGSRAVRFRHEAEARFGWNAAQRAIMAELMLRGPQTLGELRIRASRMTHLESQEYARELLRGLESGEFPIVVELPREPGKSARRFAYLLGGQIHAAPSEPAQSGHPSPAIEQSDFSPSAPQTRLASSHGGDGREAPSTSDISARLQFIEEQVANLHASLAGLRDTLRQAGIET